MKDKEEAVGNSNILKEKRRLDLSMSMIINVNWITGDENKGGGSKEL